MSYDRNTVRYTVALEKKYENNLSSTNVENIGILKNIFAQINDLYNTATIRHIHTKFWVVMKSIRDTALLSTKFLAYAATLPNVFKSILDTVSKWIKTAMTSKRQPLFFANNNKTSEDDDDVPTRLEHLETFKKHYESALITEFENKHITVNEADLKETEQQLLAQESHIQHGLDNDGHVHILNLDNFGNHIQSIKDPQTNLDTFKLNCLEVIHAYDPDKHPDLSDEIQKIVTANEIIHAYQYEEHEQTALVILKDYIRNKDESDLSSIITKINDIELSPKIEDELKEKAQNICDKKGKAVIVNNDGSTSLVSEVKIEANIEALKTQFKINPHEVKSAAGETLSVMHRTFMTPSSGPRP